jgi:hypothetical protein
MNLLFLVESLLGMALARLSQGLGTKMNKTAWIGIGATVAGAADEINARLCGEEGSRVYEQTWS